MAETNFQTSERMYGRADVAVNPGSTNTVDGTSEILVASNPDRVAAVISNNHATNVLYLKLGATAVVGEGIRVDVGETHIIDYFTGDIHAIGSAAGTTVGIAEV